MSLVLVVYLVIALWVGWRGAGTPAVTSEIVHFFVVLAFAMLWPLFFTAAALVTVVELFSNHEPA